MYKVNNRTYPCTRWKSHHIHVQRICKIVQLTYTRWTIQHISTYQSRTLPRWWKQWLRRSSATNRSRISTKSLRRSAGEGEKWRRRYRIGNCLIVQEVQQSLGEKWTLRRVSWDVIWASLCPPVLVSWSQPVLILYGQVMARLGLAWITIRSGGG